MMRTRTLVLAALAAALAAPLAAQQPSGDAALGKVVGDASAALARMRFKISNPLLTQTNLGQAVCIDQTNGVFVTVDLGGGVPSDEIKEIVLVPAGTDLTEYKAELMGVDPEENLAFLKISVKEHPWKALQFKRTGPLEPGTRVVSVGLLGPNSGNVAYMGTGYVGAHLYLPNEVVYVGGGELTIASSPVMTIDGKVIGLVGQQMPMEGRLMLGGRWGDVLMMGRQRTQFFTPVDEFAHVLADIPTSGNPRRIPWIGVVSFEPLQPTEVELRKLGNKPAVMVGQVVPDSPAAKAGLNQGDVILAMNGKGLQPMPTRELVASAFRRALVRSKPGAEMSLTVDRKGKSEEVKVKSEPAPPYPHEGARYYNPLLGFAGRDLVTLDRYAGRTSPLKEDGVVVTMVVPNTAAAAGELHPGDLITAINDKPVVSVATLKQVLDPLAKPAGNGITFTVTRGDSAKKLVINPPKEAVTQPATQP